MRETTWASAVAQPFRDRAWFAKCARQGLIALVPVYGWAALLGWQRRVFATSRIEGERSLLPEPVSTTREGIPALAAVASMIALPAVPLAIAATVLKAYGLRVSGYLPREILEPALTIYAALVYPELIRRALAHGEAMPLLRPAASRRAIAQRPAEYATAVLLSFAALIVLAIGFSLCLVGAIVSIPLAHALAAHVAARWHDEVERSSLAHAPYR